MNFICWWCVHPHENGLPFHLPLKHDYVRKRYSTIGNFCSWACTKAYAIDMDSARKGEITSILAMMRLEAIGHYEPLWHAPKRQMLQCFGGTLTIEEFRKYGGKVEPPVIHWPFEHRYVPVIEQKTHEGPKQTKTSDVGRLKAIDDSTPTADSFKLKREKPLARASSKLESALGITRKAK
jgi:hypothetical protein